MSLFFHICDRGFLGFIIVQSKTPAEIQNTSHCIRLVGLYIFLGTQLSSYPFLLACYEYNIGVLPPHGIGNSSLPQVFVLCILLLLWNKGIDFDKEWWPST